MTYEQPIAPTLEAIDAWLARQRRPGRPHDPSYGVNVWTRRGCCRCICGASSRVEHAGEVYYRTIRGEGSSNAGRETALAASRIVRAIGWMVA